MCRNVKRLRNAMETLPQLEPVVEEGELITCPHCLERHPLERGPNQGSLLLFFRCGEALRLGAIAGKLLI